jgi:hypothetical protein
MRPIAVAVFTGVPRYWRHSTRTFAAAVVLLCCSLPTYAGYSGYRLFSLDHTKAGTADSTNFPVLLSGKFAEFATVANGSKAKNTVTCGIYSITCPTDLIFTTDAFCKAPLAGWEFEEYTATTGQMIVWVIVPTLSHTVNSSVYACVGNSSTTTFQGGATGAAYDANTKVVYHLQALNDSSAGGNNLTPINSPTQTTGEIYGAASFNGVNQTAEASAFSWTGTSPVTVSFWNYVASTDVQVSFAFTVGNTTAGNNARFTASVPWSDSVLYWDYGYGSNGNTGRVSTSYAGYLNAWTYVTLVSTGSGGTLQAIYLNGVLATSAATSVASIETGDLYIGGYPNATFYGPPYEKGKIDEFRIANVVRSASWILAEYNNQFSPSTFATVGAFTLVNFVTEPQGFVF